MKILKWESRYEKNMIFVMHITTNIVFLNPLRWVNAGLKFLNCFTVRPSHRGCGDFRTQAISGDIAIRVHFACPVRDLIGGVDDSIPKIFYIGIFWTLGWEELFKRNQTYFRTHYLLLFYLITQQLLKIVRKGVVSASLWQSSHKFSVSRVKTTLRIHKRTMIVIKSLINLGQFVSHYI